MRDFEEILRFNARVLDERSPQGVNDLLKEENTIREIAFSKQAAEFFKKAGVPFTEGAGGIRAQIGVESLNKLSTEFKSLFDSAEAALEGWGRTEYRWKIGNGRTLSLCASPKLMGIVNVTPDSFSDGGCFFDKDAALDQAEALHRAGADIIDIGGESTRPGAPKVDGDEEIKRTIPIIKEFHQRTGAIISIDTNKAVVAKAALEAGASIINDISGLTFDPDMAAVAADTGAGVIIMHIRGEPGNMQKNPHYEDTIAEISLELRQRIGKALSAGIDNDAIVIDPGIGFGKRFEDNLRILAGIGELRSIGYPIMIGASRKSFFGRISGREAHERDLETCAVSTASALASVQILRVHNVEENLICLKVANAILNERRAP